MATTSRRASASATTELLDLAQRALLERADVLQREPGGLVGAAVQRRVEDLPVLLGLTLPRRPPRPGVDRDERRLLAQLVEDPDQHVVVAVDVERAVEVAVG